MTLADLEEQQTRLADVVLDDFRSRNLIQMVAQHAVPGTALDVGCGSGGMVSWMLDRGHDAKGIDSSDAIIAAAQAFLTKTGRDPARVSKRDLSSVLEAGERFDNIISMDCLEHQADDAPMFAQLVQALRPGGRLLITVPAVPALFSERDRIVGHYRRYTPDRLRSLVQAHPVRLDELRYWNLLGVAPTFVFGKLLGRAIDESFRYGDPTLGQRALRSGLSLWFSNVENQVKPPIGLTLFLCATRLGTP